VNAPLNIGVVWLIVAILLMNAVVSVTWFLLRQSIVSLPAQFQKEREQARKKTAKNGTTQTSVDKKGMPLCTSGS